MSKESFKNNVLRLSGEIGVFQVQIEKHSLSVTWLAAQRNVIYSNSTAFSLFSLCSEDTFHLQFPAWWVAAATWAQKLGPAMIHHHLNLTLQDTGERWQVTPPGPKQFASMSGKIQGRNNLPARSARATAWAALCRWQGGGLSFESRWPMALPQSWHPSQSSVNVQQFYFCAYKSIHLLHLLFHLFFTGKRPITSTIVTWGCWGWFSLPLHVNKPSPSNCAPLKVLSLNSAGGAASCPTSPAPHPVAVSRGCSRLSSLQNEGWVAFCPGN